MNDTKKTPATTDEATKETATKDSFYVDGTATFTIEVSLPYRFGDPNCCAHYGARLDLDERDNPFVEHRHETDCDVWQFVP